MSLNVKALLLQLLMLHGCISIMYIAIMVYLMYLYPIVMSVSYLVFRKNFLDSVIPSLT